MLSDPLHSRKSIPLHFAYQMTFMVTQHSQRSPKGLNFPSCGSLASFPQLAWVELLRGNGPYAQTVLWSVHIETWLVWLWYGRTSGLGSTHYHSCQKQCGIIWPINNVLHWKRIEKSICLFISMHIFVRMHTTESQIQNLDNLLTFGWEHVQKVGLFKLVES